MASSIQGCSRTTISCKKYKTIFDKYKNDKQLDEISGNGRHEHNKWFDQLDLWNGTKASVTNAIPTST
jgi:hypothetical protein